MGSAAEIDLRRTWKPPSHTHVYCSLSHRLQAPVRVGKVWAPWGRGGDQGYMCLLLPVLPSELVKTQPRPPQPSPPPT